jgi:hypothetical protein
LRKEPIFVEKIRMKKIIIAASALLTLIFVLIFYYFNGGFNRADDTALFSRIPRNASVVMEFHQDQSVFDLYRNSPLVSSIVLPALREELDFFKQHLLENPAVKDVFTGQKILASVHKAKANQLGVLYVAFCKRESFGDPKELFKELLSPKNTLSERNFGDTRIYELYFEESGKRLCFSFSDQVLLISFTPFLVEDALRQYGEGKSFASQPAFKQARELKGKQSIAGLYINYQAFPELIETFVSTRYNDRFDMLSQLAGMAVLDINYKPDAWMLNGHTLAGPDDLLHVFEGQAPQSSVLPAYFSSRLAYFYLYGISDPAVFLQSTTAWLRKRKEFLRDAELKRLNTKYRIDFAAELPQLMGAEMALVGYDRLYGSDKADQVALMRLKNTERVQQLMEEVQGIEMQNGRIPAAESYKSLVIRPMFVRKWMFLCGGKFFQDFEANYYVTIEDRMILAASRELLKSYIDDYVSLQILKENSSYKNFSAAVGDQSNVYFYASASHAGTMLNQALLPDSKGQFFKPGGTKEYYAFACQLSAGPGSFLTSIYAPLGIKGDEGTGLVWKTELDAPLSSAPYIVTNHDTGEREIMIQDDANNLYLISAAGKVIWKIPISAKILSEISQVDYYRNDKYQFLFNTEQQLYLIDRNGRMMPNYPIRFGSKATCGLALFDYDHTKNYRVFVSGENRSISGYDISGRPLDGWNPKPNVGILQHPMQHVSVQGKDFLFANTVTGDFYFFNRRGDVISRFIDTAKTSYHNPFVFDGNEQFAKNRFINTDADGKIKSVFLDGRRLYKHVGNWSPDHYFNYANVTGDSIREYIYLDKNQLIVYRDDSTIAFNYEFKADIQSAPQLFPDSSGTKMMIGVSSLATNQVFLFNEDGTLKKGFPMNGSTPFRIADLRNSGKKMLVTGSQDRYVYLYDLNY